MMISNTKRFFPTTVLCVAALLMPTFSRGDTWAVLVGINKYQNPQINSLKYPAVDATSLRDALTASELGRLPADHVKLLTDDDATAEGIKSSVTDFLAKHVKPGDSVILSLAGHGVAKGVGLEAKSYLLPSDVKGLTTAALDQSAVDLRALSVSLGKLPASQFILFVDACREDPTPGRGIKGNQLTDILARSVQVVSEDPSRHPASIAFFACRVGQRAYEDPEYKHGVFTYWILNAIQEAALAAPPKGEIDMGRLASFVTMQVEEWAKKTSSSGSYEIEQNPDLIASDVTKPVVLMNVKRISANLYNPAGSKLLVGTLPQNAQITLNGKRLSEGPEVSAEAKKGQNTLRVEAPGYLTVEKTVEALSGYQHALTVALTPSGRGASETKADEYFARAKTAEAQESWEAAAAGYQAVIGADPKFVIAYEKLAELQQKQGDLKGGLKTLIDLNAQTSPTAHSYSLLGRLYAHYALREIALKPDAQAGKKGGGLIEKFNPFKKGKRKEEAITDEDVSKAGEFRTPKDAREASLLSRKAAKEAIALDANSAEARIAEGFGLIASDRMGMGKEEALGAFGKAVFFDPKDAGANYGLGFALRYFAAFDKDEDDKKATLERAVKSLKAALEIRPNFYEAHRELAYAQHLLGNTTEAQKEYEAANANRGGASDKDEVAGINVALSSIFQQRALSSSGDTKTALILASSGCLVDAKDLSPNLETAMRLLKSVGMGRNLTDFIDSPLRGLYDKIPSIPGIRLPGFKF